MALTEPTTLDPAMLRQLTPAQANRYRIVPFGRENGALQLYTDHPHPQRLQAELRLVLGTATALHPQPTDWVSRALAQHYRKNEAPALTGTTDFIDKLLHDAQGLGSSDIHVEPGEAQGRVRMRVDGKLIERYQIPKGEYTAVVNKVKVRSGMDISEKRLPQDGRISTGAGKNGLDLRVSTLPVMHGEKIVLRLLGRSAGNLTLENTGMDPAQLAQYRSALQKPHGVILISGPTGSGKTTTLYATLQEVADSSRNVLTIEDPIEYTLEGIAQVQVKEQIGLDFPTALRTFLRQDPDIIMVGEIRDPETARMAIRASLTGHQVLSTIHTNSAWDTVMRLQDMGIPAYLVSSTLALSVAQRLVRLVCANCKSEVPFSDKKLLGEYASKAPHVLARAVGCEACHYTGYKGRKAIYEILVIDDTLAEGLKQGTLNKQQAYAHAKVSSLATQALGLLHTQATTLEETLPYFLA